MKDPQSDLVDALIFIISIFLFVVGFLFLGVLLILVRCAICDYKRHEIDNLLKE